MKKVMIALAVASVSVVGASMIENPEAEFNGIVNGIYNWGEQAYLEASAEKYGKLIGTLISTAVTTVIWISIFVMMNVVKARKTAKRLIDEVLQNGTAEIAERKKEQQTAEYQINHQIVFQETPESEVIEQAKARLLYQQLKQDVRVLEERSAWLPHEIQRAKNALDNTALLENKYKEAYIEASNNRIKAANRYTELVKDLEDEQKEIKKIHEELERLKALI